MIQKYFEINEEGHNIRCKLYCKDIHAITKTVLFVHGFGGHKDNKAAERFAERITSKYKGYSLITFNLPCHGDDVKKKLYLKDCGTYIKLVLKHINEEMGIQEVFAYATSFGGYLTLKYICENGNPFKKIALRCPAVYMYETIMSSLVKEDNLEMLSKGKDTAIGFDRKIIINREFLNDLKANDISQNSFLDYADDILIIHGTKDEIIPIQRIHDFADENVIEFITVENADHRFQDKDKMEIATQAITHFYGLS